MRLAWRVENCPRCVCTGMRSTSTGVERGLTVNEVAQRLSDLQRYGGRLVEDPTILEDEAT